MKSSRLMMLVPAAILGALLLIAGSVPQSDDPGVLLRAAIEKEEVEGDLDAAIAQYKRIVQKNGNNRAVAARALLRLGGTRSWGRRTPAKPTSNWWTPIPSSSKRSLRPGSA